MNANVETCDQYVSNSLILGTYIGCSEMDRGTSAGGVFLWGVVVT